MNPPGLKMLGCDWDVEADLRVGRMLAPGTPQEPSYPRSVPSWPKLGCDWDDLNAHSTTGPKNPFFLFLHPGLTS